MKFENDEVKAVEDVKVKFEDAEEDQAEHEDVATSLLQKTRDTNPSHPNLPDEHVLNFILEDHRIATEHQSSPFKSVKAQNLITNVGLQTIKYYHNTILPLINEYVLSHDPQYFIKLDARFPTMQNFQSLQLWLQKMCIEKSCIAHALFPHFLNEEEAMDEEEEEELEEEGEETQGEMEPTDLQMYKMVRSVNVISSFDWKLSDFGTKCPVSLFDGFVKRGKTKFSATFLDKVYFCESKKCLEQFLSDPEAFVKDPNPKPTFKIILSGFEGTNKSDFARQLCDKYYLKFVEFNSLVEKFVHTKREKTYELFKKHATNKLYEAKVFKSIKQSMIDRKATEWKNEMYALIKQKFSPDTVEEEEMAETFHSQFKVEPEPTLSMQNILADNELCLRIFEYYDLLDDYLPKNFEIEIQKEYDQKLDELVELAVSNDFEPRLSLLDVKNAILGIDMEDSSQFDFQFVNDRLPPYKGWVLNGLPLEINLWKVLKEANVLTNDKVFIFNSNETPEEESISTKSIASAIDMPQINTFDHYFNNVTDETNFRNFSETKRNAGLNRKQLAAIQEMYLNQGSIKDEDSLLLMTSFSVVAEEENEETQEVNDIEKEDIVSKSKHITFKSRVEIIPFSERLDFYEVNDQILSQWNEIKSSVLSGFSKSVLEIDILETPDVLDVIEKHLLMKYSSPVFDWIPSEDEEDVDEASEYTVDQNLAAFRDLGNTLHFCPVALKEQKQLIKGLEKHAVQYRNKLYYFKSVINKTKFMRNPNYYVNFTEPLKHESFGPLKVCVLTTVCGSGEYFSKQLSSLLNLTFVDFNYVFERDIVPRGILPIGVLYEDPATKFDLAFKDKAILKSLQELREYFNSCVELPQTDQVSMLADKYWMFHHPCTNGFLYYRFPHSIHDFRYLVTHTFLPDLIIELKVPGDQIPERILDQVKLNWITHKGAIKNKIIAYDQDLKLKYEEARRRVFRYVLNMVWSREMALNQGEAIDSQNEGILERLEAEIEYARGNEDLLEELLIKYANPREETFTLTEDDANSLFEVLDDTKSKYDSIKKLANPVDHTTSIKDIAIRYGLAAEDIDLNVMKQIHSIVCQIVPKPIYKMKSLKQQVNSPEEDLTNTHEIEQVEISKIKRVAKKIDIPWITVLPSKYNVTQCENELRRLKDPNMMESLFEVDVETANKLLYIGYFYLSKYGRLCPVEIHDMKCTLQPYLKRVELNEIHPVIHRKYIYFIHGESNGTKFKSDVLKYVNFNKPVNIFSCPMKLAICGPVKCGKSTLAKTLSDFYDLEVITSGGALRYVKRNLSWTLLADHIEACLTKGWTVPDALVARCIEVLVHKGKAPVSGYILDGVIARENLLSELIKLNIVPHLVIHLNVPRERIFSHLKQSRIPERMPFKYSPAFIDFKLNVSRFPTKHEMLVDKIRQAWDNVITVDHKTVLVNLDEITNHINIIFSAFCENFAKMKNSRQDAMTLKHMCVSPYEYDSRLHCVIENCCVGCIVEKKQFVSKSLDRANSVQFRNNYFWLCPKHYLPFLKNPDQFLCNLKPEIFLQRPRKVELSHNTNKGWILNMAENKGKIMGLDC